MRRLIEQDGLRGMTSNPTIFQKAIASGDAYNAQIEALLRQGKDAGAIFEALEFAIEGELEVDDTAIISQADEGDWVSLFGWIPRPEQRNQWLTTCPECLNPLVVASAVLEATGERVDLGTSLCGDGFEVHHPDAQQNGSTSDEVVVCTGV